MQEYELCDKPKYLEAPLRAFPVCVVVPNSLRNAINEKLDGAFAETPEAAPDRDIFYRRLLSFFNEHGYLPEFTLIRNAKPYQCSVCRRTFAEDEYREHMASHPCE